MNPIFSLGKCLVGKWFLRDVVIITYGAIPIHGPAIIAANHDNHWDPPLIILSARRRMIHFFTAKCLFNGAAGIFLRLAGQVPVQSGLVQLNKKAFKRAGKYLDRGEIVGVFPYPFDIIKKRRVLYTGIIKLIVENDAPVIPIKVELNGTGKQPKSYFDVNFTKAVIKIGSPIEGFRGRCIKAGKKDYKKLVGVLLKKIEVL